MDLYCSIERAFSAWGYHSCKDGSRACALIVCGLWSGRSKLVQNVDGSALHPQKVPGTAVVGTRPDDQERVDHIKSLHEAVVTAQRDTVEQVKNEKYEGYSLIFSDAILDLDFGPEDISTDCFHPSTKGQAKIADAVLRDIYQ